jgi:hypothetical protein
VPQFRSGGAWSAGRNGMQTWDTLGIVGQENNELN